MPTLPSPSLSNPHSPHRLANTHSHTHTDGNTRLWYGFHIPCIEGLNGSGRGLGAWAEGVLIVGIKRTRGDGRGEGGVVTLRTSATFSHFHWLMKIPATEIFFLNLNLRKKDLWCLKTGWTDRLVNYIGCAKGSTLCLAPFAPSIFIISLHNCYF